MTLQLHIHWEHEGHLYAEVHGPYVNRDDAEAAQRRALKQHPNAQADIITTPTRT